MVSDKPNWFQVVSVLEIMVKIHVSCITHSEKSPENGSIIIISPINHHHWGFTEFTARVGSWNRFF